MANTAADTLITRALDNLNRASTGTARSGATLATRGLGWLNMALRKTALEHDFKDLKRIYSMSTVATVKRYANPTNSKSIYSIRLIDGLNSVKLVQVHSWQFDKSNAYPEAYTSGRPIYYTPYGNYIELLPVPDVAYTLYARCADWPVPITTTAQLMEYTPEKDDMLVAAMTAEGFRYIQMYEDATVWDVEFARILKALAADDKDEPDWAPMGMGFTTGGSRTENNPWLTQPITGTVVWTP